MEEIVTTPQQLKQTQVQNEEIEEEKTLNNQLAFEDVMHS
jgi:hypothetical protein